jgi:hypothetical protein
MQQTNQELVLLWANTDKRKAFLANYKNWGSWLTVQELGLTYYRYDLPKGEKILVMEYQRRNPYPIANEESLQTVVVYYLWDGAFFIPNPAGEYFITDKLKNLKVEMQKDIRAKADANIPTVANG